MQTVELNIGLAVGTNTFSAYNTLGEISERANTIERVLRGQLTCKVRREWSFEREPTLVVEAVVYDDVTQFHAWIHELAERFHQDCIAVYYPQQDKGYLLGPNAEAWGDFQLDYFVKYH